MAFLYHVYLAIRRRLYTHHAPQSQDSIPQTKHLRVQKRDFDAALDVERVLNQLPRTVYLGHVAALGAVLEVHFHLQHGLAIVFPHLRFYALVLHLRSPLQEF